MSTVGPRCTLLVDDGIVTVSAVGEVDAADAAFLRDRLSEAYEACIGVLAVDLSACTHLWRRRDETLLEAVRCAPPGRYRLQITAVHPNLTACLDAAAIPQLDLGSRLRPRPVGAAKHYRPSGRTS